jgi:hypothetical protein
MSLVSIRSRMVVVLPAIWRASVAPSDVASSILD